MYRYSLDIGCAAKAIGQSGLRWAAAFTASIGRHRVRNDIANEVSLTQLLLSPQADRLLYRTVRKAEEHGVFERHMRNARP